MVDVYDAKLAELRQAAGDIDNHKKMLEFQTRMEDILQSNGSDELALPPGTMATGGDSDSDIEVEVTQQSINLKCPVTGKEMTDPVKNKHCTHNYERTGIIQLMQQRKGKAKCPVS